MPFVSHIQHLQRAAFLREAAALQRTNTSGTHRLAEITFPTPEGPDDLARTVITTSGSTVRMETTAIRSDLHTALTAEGWAAPAMETMTPAEATAPPLLVYADLLADLGDHLFLLTRYPADVGRPDLADSRLSGVRLIGETTAEVQLSALGNGHRVHIALSSGVPLGVVPLGIAEWLLAFPRNLRFMRDVTWEFPVDHGPHSAPQRWR